MRKRRPEYPGAARFSETRSRSIVKSSGHAELSNESGIVPGHGENGFANTIPLIVTFLVFRSPLDVCGTK